ncbi:hypothetical protein CIPAW_09G166100 [Carya illinoinensis]|uniref:Uncharacterized protein n=1 Tax=Carya illinoinensis TaxID=32201 RepID=A0A8T1PMN5_CARIL|nr:hypothetical protein CIPAW_09G166100 [Carya illinoinensis]
MAQKAASLRLFVLLAVITYLVVSSAAIPTTRSIKPNYKEDPSTQDPLDELKFKDKNEGMNFETADYNAKDPAGPNKGHEPKTPGTS